MTPFLDGEKIRVNAKVGRMKKAGWIKGVVLESKFDDEVLVETKSGQKIWTENSNVKHDKTLEYNQETQSFPEVDKFVEANWTNLISVIENTMKEFFPKMKVSTDEEEKIINIEDIVSISASIETRETLSSFIEVPVWDVSVYSYVPGNYDEPPSTDLCNVGYSPTNYGTAKIAIDVLMKERISSYFESQFYEDQ
jgi:hypothetical protein